MEELATEAKVKATEAKVVTTEAKVPVKASMVCCIAHPMPLGFVCWVCFGVCF